MKEILDEAVIAEHSSTYLNSTDTRLASISVNFGLILPDFDSIISEYAVEFPDGLTTVSIPIEPFISSATVFQTKIIRVE